MAAGALERRGTSGTGQRTLDGHGHWNGRWHDGHGRTGRLTGTGWTGTKARWHGTELERNWNGHWNAGLALERTGGTGTTGLALERDTGTGTALEARERALARERELERARERELERARERALGRELERALELERAREQAREERALARVAL